MDRDPGELAAGVPPEAIADVKRHLIDDIDVASEARALADFEAGRFYAHAIVSRWLRTWGSPGQVPFKDWLAAQNG